MVTSKLPGNCHARSPAIFKVSLTLIPLIKVRMYGRREKVWDPLLSTLANSLSASILFDNSVATEFFFQDQCYILSEIMEALKKLCL